MQPNFTVPGGEDGKTCRHYSRQAPRASESRYGQAFRQQRNSSAAALRARSLIHFASGDRWSKFNASGGAPSRFAQSPGPGQAYRRDLRHANRSLRLSDLRTGEHSHCSTTSAARIEKSALPDGYRPRLQSSRSAISPTRSQGPSPISRHHCNDLSLAPVLRRFACNRSQEFMMR